MRLTRIRQLGRFKNPDTGRFVNVHKGDRVGYGDAIHFYLFRGKRQIITERDFYERWKHSKENAKVQSSLATEGSGD